MSRINQQHQQLGRVGIFTRTQCSSDRHGVSVECLEMLGELKEDVDVVLSPIHRILLERIPDDIADGQALKKKENIQCQVYRTKELRN